MRLPALSTKIMGGILLLCALAGGVECAKAQNIYTIAGTIPGGFSGDGGPASAATLHSVADIAFDAAGNLYIADEGNHRIRKINTAGIISTVAGIGTSGFSGDGGPATAAQLDAPYGVTIDGAGNLYVVEMGNSRIRKINTSGIISTIAGNGTFGFSGDGGPATAASLQNASDVAVDAAGNVYTADCSNHRIRKVNTSGIISTFAGTGSTSYSGDGGPATAAAIGGPRFLTFDGAGNLYFTDYGNDVVRKVNTSGIISTVAGDGTMGYGGDGGPATAAQMHWPMGIAFDGAGNLYVGEYNGRRVRKINPSGIISTYAGYGMGGFGGDGGPATGAQFNFLIGVTVDLTGDVRIADGNRIRKICYPPAAATISGPASMVCAGSSLSLTASIPGGAWSSATGHTSVSGGTVTGISPGLDTISYTLTNSCYFTRTQYAVTVNSLPAAGVISGTSPICVGASDTFSDASPGGVWSSATTGIIALSGSTGATVTVTGAAAGTDTVYYSVTNSCGTAVAAMPVTVDPLPVAGTIIGASGVCVSATITLTDATTGGVWSSSLTGIATIGSTGVVTGVSRGTTIISYSVTNSCGTAVATMFVTVNPLPVAGIITGIDSVCPGLTVILTDTIAGGTWTCSNALATVSGTGAVTGVSPGVDTIIYTVTNICGTAHAIFPVKVLSITLCPPTNVNISSRTQATIKIYPNPTQNELTIVSTDEIKNVTITNLLGETVFSNEYNTEKIQIEVTDLPAGLYFVNINNSEMRKFLKL